MKILKTRIVSSTLPPATGEPIFAACDLSAMFEIIKEVTGYDVSIENGTEGDFSFYIDQVEYPISR